MESVSTDVAVLPAVNGTVGSESEQVGTAEMVSEPEYVTAHARFALPLNPPKELMVRVSSPVAPGAGKVTCRVEGVTVMPAALLTTGSTAEVEDDVYRSPGQTAVML